MQRRQFLSFGGAIVLAGLIGSCAGPVEELRYRLTVEVDTPEGLKTGSSVIEVRGQKNPDWVNPEGRGTRSSFRGEAVAVDLPGGQTLFALLRTESGISDAADYPWFAFRERLKDSKDWVESLQMMRQWKGEIVPITGTEEVRMNGIQQVPVLPLLVTFADMRDPMSVERVDPGALDKTFGPGVSLRRITVMVTDDDVTEGVDSYMQTLGLKKGQGLDPAKGVRANPTWAEQLGYTHFVRR